MDEMTAGDTDDKKAKTVLPVQDIDKQLREYTKLMHTAAADLDFENAILYRDKIKQLEDAYLKS